MFTPKAGTDLTVSLPGEQMRVKVSKVIDRDTVIVELGQPFMRSHSFLLGDLVACRRTAADLGETWNAIEVRTAPAIPASLPASQGATQGKPTAQKKRKPDGNRWFRRESTPCRAGGALPARRQRREAGRSSAVRRDAGALGAAGPRLLYPGAGGIRVFYLVTEWNFRSNQVPVAARVAFGRSAVTVIVGRPMRPTPRFREPVGLNLPMKWNLPVIRLSISPR
jgi:hypothetical protein